MTAVDVRTPAGKASGSVELPAEIFDVQVNIPLMHQVVVARHHVDVEAGEVVEHAAHFLLVARNGLRREDDEVARLERDVRVLVLGDAGDGGARLALPAGRDDQHLAARQVHRCVEVNQVRQVLEIAAGLGRADDPIKRVPGNAEPPIGRLGHFT